MRWLLCWGILASSTFLSMPLWAQNKELSKEDKQKATQLFDEAEAYYAVQEYEKALELYKSLFLLTKKSELLFNIGQCYRNLARFEEAKKSYLAFLNLEPKSSYRQGIEKLLLELDQAIEEQKKKKADPKAVTPTPTPTVEKISKSPPPLENPTPTGEEPLQGAAKDSSTSAETSALSPMLFWSATGLTAATALGTGLFALSNNAKANDAANLTFGETPDPALVKDLSAKAKRFGLISDISWLATAGLAAGAVVFQKKQAKVNVQAWATPTQVMLRFEF